MPVAATQPMPGMMRGTSSAAALAAWLLVTVGSGFLVGMFSDGGESAWYASLDKAPWNPPSWVFAPVWTALYATMGLAAWLVWREGGWHRRGAALSLFVVQLALNLAWSPIFFDAQRPGLALIEMAALWLLLALTIRAFARVRVLAAALLVPYFLWITFAFTLNAWIVRAN